MQEIIEKLEHGIMICIATHTGLVHLDRKDAEIILEVLKEKQNERQ